MAKAKSAERTESLRMKTKRARKAKKPKKEGPKRSTSAYFYFMADKRAALKEEYPEMKVQELAKLLGAAWKKLSDEEKVPYQKMAATDKKRYENEKKAFAAKEAEREEEEEGEEGEEED